MGSTSPAAVTNVFVYGSLLSDDVVRALLSRVPPSLPAVLPNYQRFSIKRRVYPGIIPVKDKEVPGKVLLGITPTELHILDEFEDVEYDRKTVDVVLKDSSESMLAETYVWENKNDPELYGEWNFEMWKQLHLKDFLKMTVGFREELELPDPKHQVESYETYCQGVDNNNPAYA